MTEIKIMDCLDAKEQRLKALEVLKEKMLLLVDDYIGYATCDHPAHMKESRKKADELFIEMVYRRQDFEVFMYDYQKDWDLNYQDYGLDKVYERKKYESV